MNKPLPPAVSSACPTRVALILLLCMTMVGGIFAQTKKAKAAVPASINNWTLHPFAQKEFVENKRQFDGLDHLQDSKILFGVRNEGPELFFTVKGLTYRHSDPVQLTEREKEKLEKKGIEPEMMVKMNTDSLTMEWLNSNPNVEVVGEHMVENYYTYGDDRDKSGQSTILAHAYKKIIYKNLYPNIDVEYSFPENKEGFKYTLILHPGADISQVKMKYSGNGKISDLHGDVSIPFGSGKITDHAPETYYENGGAVKSWFNVEKNVISFGLDAYDHSKTLVVDPWTTVPTFTANTKAYDVDYDFAGNVYIYGGNYPFQEQKLNSAGVIQWTYSFTFLYGYYGDFAVDQHSQRSYLIEGFNTSGARIVKVGPTGLQLGVLPQNANMVEMWRVTYNPCTHNGVIAGGGTSFALQACALDTNVATIAPTNVLGATTALHDLALCAQDNANTCWMASARSVVYPTVFDNVMLKMPVPALAPTAWMVPDGYTFQEVGSVSYSVGPPNGFNGMAVSPNFLYTYDGVTLKEWNKTTGAFITSTVVGGTSFASGGLTVDNCDHVFVGNGTSIKQYNSSLALVSTIAAANTVYDVRLGPGNILYACGNAFVSQIPVTLSTCSSALTMTISATSLCSPTNTATVTVTGGTGPYTYSWSTTPVQTTATATGLSAGWYYVNVTDASCTQLTGRDSVQILPSTPPVLTITPNTAICAGGSVNLSVSGATTYSWTPSTGLSSTTISNPVATPATTTTYTVTGTTGSCTSTATVTITVNPNPVVTASPNVAICNGGSTPLTASGATTYSWTPSTGLSSTTVSNPTATPTVTTTYTVTGTTGTCTGTATVTVTVNPNPVVTASPNVAICAGGSTPLTASGATTYSWSPATGLSSTTVSNPTANPAATTTYTVTGTTGSCTGTATVTVTVNPNPVITVSPNTAICAGGSTPLTASGATTYSWTPSTGLSSTTVSNPTANPTTTTTYTVTGTTGSCTGTGTVTITVNPNPVVTASPNVSVCPGGSTPLSASGATTYSWTPSTGLSSTTISNPTSTPPATTTYTVTGTSLGCTGTATVTVTVAPNPTITVTPNTTICAGSSLPLSAGGATTYSWTPSTGLSSTTVSNPTATPATTTTYTVTGTTGTCTGTATVTITIDPTMVLNVTMTGSTCGNPNGSVTEVVTSGGMGTFTPTWTPGNQTTSTVTGLSAGTYSVTVVDGNGCTATGSVVVTNSGGPTLTLGTVTNVSCFGACDGSIATTTTGGTAPYVYSWTGSSSTSGNATGLCPGTYTCTVTDANGCSQSVSAPITQPAVLNVTIPTSTNVSCNGGSNGTASATVTGGTTLYSYSWNPAPGGGQGTANATGLSAQTYTLTVTDNHNCTASATIAISQPAALTLALAGTPATCNGLCNGVLICIPSGGTSPYNYSWSTGCTSASCNNICAGTYSITVTDGNGCTATGNVSVTQPTAMALTTSSVTAHCNQADGSATVSVTGGTGPAYVYTWTPPPGTGSTTTTYSSITPNTYTVMVHDQNGCADSATVTVGNVPGITVSIPTSTNVSCNGGSNGTATATTAGGVGTINYTWTPGTITGGSTPNASGLSAGTYTCSVVDGVGCTNTATITITQPTPVVETPMAGVTICINGCTPLTTTPSGGTGTVTPSWTNNSVPVTPPVCPTTTTTYTVVGTDANGCVSPPAFVTVTVNPPLEVTTAGAASLCPGSSATLTATATGGSGSSYVYTWIPATGLSSTSGPTTTATPTVTTTYTVIVSDNCNSPTDSAMVTVTLYPTPVITLTVNDTAECAPFCFNFNGTSVPTCATANWTFGDGGVASGCGAQTHCYTTAGLYSVNINITDVNGCTASLNKANWINVWPVPEAVFTAGPQPTTILNSTINFTDASTGAATWLWNFGDVAGGTSTLQNPHYTYPDTGCYNVTEYIKSIHGCLDTAYSVVCIQGDFTFFAPNAFTPDGDGKNDIWLPQGIGIDPNNYNLMMFDRWGNLIWYTDTWGKGWDGRANNGSDVAQIDTYVWKVKLKDFQGNQHAYTGVCNLIK